LLSPRAPKKGREVVKATGLERARSHRPRRRGARDGKRRAARGGDEGAALGPDWPRGRPRSDGIPQDPDQDPATVSRTEVLLHMWHRTFSPVRQARPETPVASRHQWHRTLVLCVGRQRVRWNGTFVTTVLGRNSSVPFRISARWL